MKTIILLSVSVYLITALSGFSQTINNLQLPTSINDNGDPPHPSAILDVQSPEKGLRIPSMTTEQRNAIPDPAAGLMIYNITDSCFNYFTGDAWLKDCGRSLTADTEPAVQYQSTGTGYEEAQNIALDIAGNIYITGRFSGTAQFGTYVLNSSGGDDVFIVKINPEGETVWAKQGAGSGVNDFGRSICIDHEGNILATGQYEGPSITFDATVLTTNGISDLYLVKFDPQGNLIWAKTGNTNVDAYSFAITSDGAGNIFITGSFSGTLNLGTAMLTSVSVNDVFLIKFDLNGNAVWARSGGGSSTNDFGNGIAMDHLGNIWITGSYMGGTLVLGPTTLPNPGIEDVFVAKYNPAGDVLWAKAGGGSGQDLCGDICVDPAGNAYVTGVFQTQAIFGPYTVNGLGYDAFIVKYDPNGNEVWVRIGTGSNSLFGDAGWGIAVDESNDIIVTGGYNNDIFFDPVLLTSSGSNDIFVVKYDTLGNVIWAKSGGGYKYDIGHDVTTDVSGNVFVTGQFDSTAFFGNTTLNGSGNGSDVPVWKLSPTGGNYLLTNNLSRSGSWISSEGDIHNANGGNVGVGEADPSHQLTIRSSNSETMRLIGPIAPFYYGAKLNFGDADIVYINEPEDDVMRIQANRVGIRRFPFSNELELDGQASKSVAGSWLANSDARLKKHIQPLDPDLMLEKMLSLQGITYEWNDNKTGMDRPKGVQYGFTAQNIQKTFPSLVEEDALGYLQTPYGTYDAMLVEAIRALYNRIQVLESENESLLSRLAEKEKQNDVQIQKIMNLLQNAGLTTEN